MTANEQDNARQYTASLVLIGDELLSGRTQDANLVYLAQWLNDRGVRLAEARIIPDDADRIVGTVNELRAVHDYVFTTGGIGPTHDDITAESIARAVGRKLVPHPKAYKALQDYYGEADFTPARQKMAMFPEGAELIENDISIAPGFRVENIFVMAGVPSIMRAMLEMLGGEVTGGAPLSSVTAEIDAPESALAGMLAEIQEAAVDVAIGSYPKFEDGRPSIHVVVRSTDAARAERVIDDVIAHAGHLGYAGQRIG